MPFRIRREQLGVLRSDKLAAGLVDHFRGAGQEAERDAATGDVVVADALGHRTRYTFDADGFISAMVTPLGRRYRLGATRDGAVALLANPAGSQVAFEYGARGDLARLIQNGREVCRYDHDAVHRLVRVTYADKTTTLLNYHHQAAPASVTDRLGNVESFEYTKDGALSAFRDGNGNRTSFRYATWDRPVATAFADGSQEAYRFGADGRVSAIEAGAEPLVEIAYDHQGRPSEFRYADGRVVSFERDADGRPLKAVNDVMTVAFAYDDEGRVLTDDQDGQAVKYAYDAVGNLVELTYPSGKAVRFSYDADRRLTGVTDWNGGSHRFTWKAGDAGYELASDGGVRVDVTQSPRGRPLSYAVGAPAGVGRVFSLAFGYDADDRLTAVQDSAFGARSFCYDAEGQVLSATALGPAPAESFRYDAAGNRVRCGADAAEFNSLNQLVRQGGAACRYDGRGNMTRCPGRGGEWRLTYNRQNLLAQADGPHGTRLLFSYDAFGRRVRKRLQHAGELLADTTYWWAGENLIAEATSSGGATITREYLYLPGTHTPLAMCVGGAVYLYHCDPLGTPTRLTDRTGRVVWSAVSGAFGRAHTQINEVHNPLRFPGHCHDGETDLHYNRFRYYSPQLGRYLSRDPMGLPGGTNLYGYADNNPVNHADPLGLFSWKAAASIAAGVVAAAATAAIIVATAPVSLPALAIAAGAAAMGVGVGLGVNKALNLKHLCVPCALKAFGLGFLQGVGVALLGIAAIVTFPAYATAIAVGGAAVGITLMLGEHFGWWGKSYDQMTPEEQSASLGGLWGNLTGGVVTGAAASKMMPAPKEFPGSTPSSDAAAANVVDAMEDAGVGANKAKVVTVLSHEDGSVSVGTSGSSKNAASVQQSLAGRLPDNYTVGGDMTNPEAMTPAEYPDGSSHASTTCAETRAYQAAQNNPSPVEGQTSVWRGDPAKNPYPADPNATSSTINPCPSCQQNQSTIMGPTQTTGSQPPAGAPVLAPAGAGDDNDKK